MPSLQSTDTLNASASCSNDRSQTAQRPLTLPKDLLDRILNAASAIKNSKKTKQATGNDASRLREFLDFCEGHGIKSSDAFPAKEDLLVAWAASYAGRLAGTTVAAKVGSIKKEHKRRGLIWQGGELLRRILKGVEELRPVSSINSKRASLSSTLEDSNRGLTAAGDVKPATPKSSSDGDDDVKAEPAIIVEDSSESDSDGDAEMADAVPAVNGLNKRKAKDDAQPQAKKVKLDGDAPEETKSIFVGRLSWTVDNDRLAQEFAHCGEVESADVPKDRDSGKSRGFGYVRFTTSEAVEIALLMDGQEIDGRAVNIARDKRVKAFGDNPPSNKLFVANLAEISEDTVRNFFNDYGVKNIRLPIDYDTGRPKGFGFVEFEDVDSAKKAFEAKNGADIEGRSIRLEYYRESSGGSRGGGRGFGDRGGRGGFGNRGRGSDRGRGRGAPRGMSGTAAFEGKKITFELTFEDKKITF